MSTQSLGCFRKTILSSETRAKSHSVHSLCDSFPPECVSGIACCCSLEPGCYHEAIHLAAETFLVPICVALLGVTLGRHHCRRALAAPEVALLDKHSWLEQTGHMQLRLQALPTSVTGESGFSSLCLSTTERHPFAFSCDPLDQLDPFVNGLFKFCAPCHPVEGRV